MGEKKRKISIEEIIAYVLLIAMLVVLTGQVVGRYCFGQSNSWSEEIARYMFVWFIMIAGSYACLENIHLKVDVAMNIFPKKIRPWIECLGLTIFIVYAVTVAYLSGKYAVNMAITGQISQGLKLPMVYVYSAIPVCHVLMAFRCFQWLLKGLKRILSKQPAEIEEVKTEEGGWV